MKFQSLSAVKRGLVSLQCLRVKHGEENRHKGEGWVRFRVKEYTQHLLDTPHMPGCPKGGVPKIIPH